MTNAQVLAVCRRALNEVDVLASDLTDQELMAALADERDLLELKLVPDFKDYTIGTDDTDLATFGIRPDPTLEVGTILALRAAATLLRQTYRQRVSRGEIGVSWSSGLESESSLAAGKDYMGMVRDLETEVQDLITIKLAPLSGLRVQ
jgi:hypothetical protein